MGRPERHADRPVHPRLCGEHHASVNWESVAAGSSPPVRGTPSLSAECDRSKRFIPACAGNTKVSVRWERQTPVHPRLCGEHASSKRSLMSPSGSSPPVRGTQGDSVVLFAEYRFIPACAGNTHHTVRFMRHTPVHPRLCGEHCLGIASNPALHPGSSPPVRGTRRA